MGCLYRYRKLPSPLLDLSVDWSTHSSDNSQTHGYLPIYRVSTPPNWPVPYCLLTGTHEGKNVPREIHNSSKGKMTYYEPPMPRLCNTITLTNHLTVCSLCWQRNKQNCQVQWSLQNQPAVLNMFSSTQFHHSCVKSGVSWTAKKTIEWFLNKAGVKRELLRHQGN